MDDGTNIKKENGTDLSEELARLRAENEGLYHRIDELEVKLSRMGSERGEKTGDDSVSHEWYKEVRQSRLMSVKYYPRYLVELIKSTSVYNVYLRILAYFRRFRLFSTIFRVLTKIVIWAETSAVFIVSFSAVILIVLPVTGVLFVASLLIALFGSKKANERIADAINGKKVYVFFGNRRQMKKNGAESSFFYENVRSFASEGSVCLVVSPYFFRKNGFGGKGAYFTERNEYGSVYMVRRNYYFVLRRTVLGAKNVADDLIFIY